MKKPTKVYFGCRCKGRELNEVLKILTKENVSYEFFNDDSDDFVLVENNK